MILLPFILNKVALQDLEWELDQNGLMLPKMDQTNLPNRRKHFGAMGPAGPIGFVGSSTDNTQSSNSTTQTYSHTVPTGTKIALTVRSKNDTPVSGVTFGGVALTKIREEGFGFAGSSIWAGNTVGAGKITPGTANVVITYTSATPNAIARADNLENVNQTTMSDADNGQNGSLSSSSLAVTIAADGLAMDCVAADFWPLTKSGGGTQVQDSNSSDGSLEGATSYHSTQTAGSRTLGWTISIADDMGHSVVSFKNG